MIHIESQVSLILPFLQKSPLSFQERDRDDSRHTSAVLENLKSQNRNQGDSLYHPRRPS